MSQGGEMTLFEGWPCKVTLLNVVIYETPNALFQTDFFNINWAFILLSLLDGFLLKANWNKIYFMTDSEELNFSLICNF